MRRMMYVGTRCSGGPHILRMGKTEIQPNVGARELHAQLRREGWEDHSETCLLEGCEATTFVPVEHTFLVSPVETIAERVEFP